MGALGSDSMMQNQRKPANVPYSKTPTFCYVRISRELFLSSSSMEFHSTLPTVGTLLDLLRYKELQSLYPS